MTTTGVDEDTSGPSGAPGSQPMLSEGVSEGETVVTVEMISSRACAVGS